MKKNLLVAILVTVATVALSAQAGVPECKQRCGDKFEICYAKQKYGDDIRICQDAKRECDKDCEAAGK